MAKTWFDGQGCLCDPRRADRNAAPSPEIFDDRFDIARVVLEVERGGRSMSSMLRPTFRSVRSHVEFLERTNPSDMTRTSIAGTD